MIKLYHFHNGSGGGVLSVIQNLVKFSKDTTLEHHIIYTINKDETPQYHIPVMKGVVSEQVFYFSPKWNFYHTCSRLAKLLPGDKAVLIAHDWLELGMISNLGLQNPVVHFLHGDFDYYYELAIKQQESIDQFIAVSPVIHQTLSAKLPERITDIHYRRFPVVMVTPLKKENRMLKLFYCVRSLEEERKQFNLLPVINENLQSKGLEVDWTIIGAGMEKEKVEKIMKQKERLSFFSAMPNREVIKLMPQHDLFILPSLKEGFPVAVVEAMKAGLVPLVTNWNGATDELIIHGQTGFYLNPGEADKYAEIIIALDEDRGLLERMSLSAIKKANELFDPVENTKLIEDVLKKSTQKTRKNKPASKAYGSRLDERWIPNFITQTIRSFT